MDFKWFFQLHEIADFATKDTSGVQFKTRHDQNKRYQFDMDCRSENPGGNIMDIHKCVEEKLKKEKPTDFVRNFEVNGNRFEVHLIAYVDNLMSSSFVQSLMDLGAQRTEIREYLKNVYYLSLEGPSGYSSTKANQGASEVYTQLLLTVKKLAEDYKVDGLVFTPYEPGMGLVYARFIKNFTDFEIVDSGYGLYLSKKIIDQIAQKHPEILKVIAKSSERHREELKSVRSEKVRGREEAGLARGMIGKIVVFNSYNGKHVGLVYGYEHGWVHLYYIGSHGVDYTSIRMDQLFRLKDHPEMQGDYEEFKKLTDEGRQAGSFHPMARVAQVVGDHMPYEGRLPSDTQGPAAGGNPAGWGSV